MWRVEEVCRKCGGRLGRVDEYGRLETRVAGYMKESKVAGDMGEVGECSGKCGGRLERFVGSIE